MPSVGSLTVEIAADIAKLRSGVEETQARLASLERTTSTTGANMQAAMERSVAGINAAWVKMAAAAATAMQAWSFAEQAAGFQEQKDMLAGLAASYQTTADNILTSIQEASTGLISKTDAMNVALAGLTKGLSPKNLTDLAAAVDTLGDSVGKSATEAFKDLSEAIEKGTEKAIKLYIGAVDLDRVMSKLPNTATEHEKAQARLNAVLEHAAKIQSAMGEAGDSVADKMDRFKVVVNDLKLALGSGLVSAGLATVSVFQGIVGAAFRVIEVANRLQALNPANSKTTKSYYEAHAQAAKSTAAELFKDMRSNWEMAWKGAPTPKGIPIAMGSGSRSASDREADKRAAREQKLIQDELIKDAQEKADALRKIYEISNHDAETIARIELEREEKKLRLYERQVETVQVLNQQIADGQAKIDQKTIMRGMESTNIGAPFEQLMAGIGGTDPIAEQIKALQTQYDEQRKLYEMHTGDMIQIGEDFYNKQSLLAQMGAQRDIAIAKLNRQQRINIASDAFGTMAAVAQAFYAASENQSRAALAAYKVLAIAQTIIDTIQAAQSSYAFGAKFGGPALGAAFAAVAVTAGLARVAQISAIHPGTSTVSAGGPSSGVPVSAPTNEQNTTSTTAITEKAQAVPNIQIYVQGNIIDQDKFARELLPSIRKAWSDNG